MFKKLDFDKYVGQRVHVYRNLHHKEDGKFSVQVHGKVVGYTDRLLIRDVQFYVSQSTRARALSSGKNGRRTVHAWAIGYLIAQDFDLDSIPGAIEIRYNYKEHSSFVVVATNESVYDSEFFAVHDGKAFITRAIDSTQHPRQLSLFG
jgi:hypothetical protein